MRMYAIVAGVAIVVSAPPAFCEERLTVEQAVQLAHTNNFSLRAVQSRAGAVHDIARVSRAALLPQIHLLDLFQRWNCAAAVSIQPFGVDCEDDVRLPARPNLSAFTPEQQAQLG